MKLLLCLFCLLSGLGPYDHAPEDCPFHQEEVAEPYYDGKGKI
ncbi:hypothetical protein [uncultured Dubosiella sp.]|nr:hypothetical protein [uncultured Dubosiella sp.]